MEKYMNSCLNSSISFNVHFKTPNERNNLLAHLTNQKCNQLMCAYKIT